MVKRIDGVGWWPFGRREKEEDGGTATVVLDGLCEKKKRSRLMVAWVWEMEEDVLKEGHWE